MQTGYPVLSVCKTPSGIFVRQDRLLEGEDPEALTEVWSVGALLVIVTEHLTFLSRPVPLGLRSVDADGRPSEHAHLVLEAREKTFPVHPVGAFKLNASSAGFCAWLAVAAAIRSMCSLYS
jgi:hypothetical protein